MSVGAQFPLAHRVDPPDREPGDLLAPRHREPQLDERRAGVHQHLLELGNRAQELFVLLGRAVPHHPLDAGPVVPRPVEEPHLTPRREVAHVALEEPLALLALRRHAERDHLGASWIEVFEEPFDRATLASSVATLENQHQLVAGRLDPVLRLEQLDLEVTLERFVLGSRHPLVVRIALTPGVDRQTIGPEQDRIVDLIEGALDGEARARRSLRRSWIGNASIRRCRCR